MPKKFKFLCGCLDKVNYIYAIKCDQHPWNYFEEMDSLASEHESLPVALGNVIASLEKVQTIEINLSDEVVKNYYENDEFIFKNKVLKTFLTLAGKSTESRPTKQQLNTADISFYAGRSNPLLFLAEFEKCGDVKTESDKTYKIRNFVDEAHKPEFSQLHFTSDWVTVKTTFLKKYALPFIQNKRKALNFTFEEEFSLRSFVKRKLSSLETYTTLPFVNQMEIILGDLPDDIAHLFMVNEKFDAHKNDILAFCDSIQEVVAKCTQDENIHVGTDPSAQMKIFNYDPDDEDDANYVSQGPSTSSSRCGLVGLVREKSPLSVELSDQMEVSDDTEHVSQDSLTRSVRSGRGRKRGGSSTGKIDKRNCRPVRKKLMPILEGNEDNGLDFLEEISDSSQSTSSSRRTCQTRYSLRSRSTSRESL